MSKRSSDLPGTGGDIAMRVDGTDDDVEGHRKRADASESARRDDSDSARRDGSESARRVDGSDEDDVEGHRKRDASEDARRDDSDSARRDGSESARRVDGGDDDVEGHLYRLGPTTEGEFARRGPGENPNGDR